MKATWPSYLRNYTTLPVYSIVSGMQVQPGSVYVLPPNHELVVQNVCTESVTTHPNPEPATADRFLLQLFGRRSKKFFHRDYPFRSGSDGSQGVRAIKNAGGMVMVQTPIRPILTVCP